MDVTNPRLERPRIKSDGGPVWSDGAAALDQTDEAAIIARCVAGERRAYAVLVERYKDLVHDIVYRMVGDPTQAEDIAQEAFVKAFVALKTFRGEARFSTWLCRIAMNQCKDVLRRQAREPHPLLVRDDDDAIADIPDHGETPAVTLERQQNEQRLHHALARLPVAYREVVVLRHIEGMDFREIGRVVGISAGAAKVRAFRGREILRQLIESAG